jgi:hypothetical protein
MTKHLKQLRFHLTSKHRLVRVKRTTVAVFEEGQDSTYQWQAFSVGTIHNHDYRVCVDVISARENGSARIPCITCEGIRGHSVCGALR